MKRFQTHQRSSILIVAAALCIAAGAARADYVTETWGNSAACRHRDTVKVSAGVITVDLSAIKGKTVHRAVLRSGISRRSYDGRIDISPAGGGKPLALLGPWYKSFDATAAVQAAAKAGTLRLKTGARVKSGAVVLAVSYEGKPTKAIGAVTQLEAIHQAGQTFLTFREIEDPVGDDSPTFEPFHKAVDAARKKRAIRYNVYRSDKHITAATLASAELVLDIPEIITCWNLKAVRNTEHPNQGTPTMKSFLRPGYNNARGHVMTRYIITDGGEPLPRATGLAAVTVRKPGKRHYAVTASVDGCEAVASIESFGPVDERPAMFPAIIFQRSIGGKDTRKRSAGKVDVYNSWVGEPYHNVPTQSETYICRWNDLPKASPDKRLPLWVVTGTYGSTASEMGNPGWYNARKHLTGAKTLGLSEGGIWQGFHECIGTLRSYDQGLVHNYPQRRVLGAAAWGVWKKDFFVDPQRVYFWSQLGSWALRHGDTFAVVMSNGYGALPIGRVAQNYGWTFGTGPKGSKNQDGQHQWEYANIARWIRENPTVELPYWMCWPAYGAYPSHTVGDFGFLPWPEMLHAMHSTKRAFSAVWNSNGPGAIRPLLPLVTRIRRDQSLPAFGNCNLDASPGDGNHADAEKSGGINLYQLWEPETIVDEPKRWEISLSLRKDCPADVCETDVTPRRCRKFKAEARARFNWQVTDADKKVIQSGAATADKWGLVTAKKIRIPRAGCRLVLKAR